MPRFISTSDAHLTAPEWGGNLSREELEVVHIFADTLDRALINLAPNKPVPDSIIKLGAPTIVAGNCIDLQTNAKTIQTFARDAADQTILSLQRSAATMADAANRPVYYGNGVAPPLTGEAGNSFGNLCRVTALNAERFQGCFGNSLSDDAAIADAVAVADHNAWHVICTEIISGGGEQGIAITNLTAGTSRVLEGTALPRYPLTSTYDIGGSTSVSEGGVNQNAMWIKWNKRMPFSTILQNYAEIKTYQMKRFNRAC